MRITSSFVAVGRPGFGMLTLGHVAANAALHNIQTMFFLFTVLSKNGNSSYSIGVWRLLQKVPGFQILMSTLATVINLYNDYCS